MRISQDEGHRHGLAQRPAEAEENGPDDGGAGVGQADPPHGLPGRGPEGERRPSLSAIGHGHEHIAHDRGDEGDDHDRQDDAGGEHADADGRTR